MARENLTQQRARAAQIEERMLAHYGEGECSLDYLSPFTLTVSVILSAQCTDAAVNKVTPELFARYGTPEVHINFIGPVIGSHTGPNTIGIFFVGKER